MTTQAHIPDLDLSTQAIARFAPDGLVERMDAEQLGAFLLLLQHSWRQTPPCTLTSDDAELGYLACTDRWERVRPVLLRAFKPDQASGRLVNAAALAIFTELSARDLKARQSGQAAAEARWAKKRQMRPACDPHAKRMRPASDPHAPGIPAPSLRSESSGALSLQRSTPADESERSAGRTESADSVIGILGAGARALEHSLFASWCVEQSTRLLEDALRSWEQEGLADVPLTKAREMAKHPGATPPVVETAIEICRGEIQRRRKTRPNGPIDFRPFGKLVVLLGQKREGNLPPVAPILAIANRWEARFQTARETFRSQAAIDLRRLQSQVPSPASQAGGA